MLLSAALLNLTTEYSPWNITKTLFGHNNYEIIYNSNHFTSYDNFDDFDNTNIFPLNNRLYKSNILDDFIIKVYYPSNSSSPSKYPIGGIGFYSTPNEIYNATDVTFSYSVKFDKTFNPVLGGKLPGLFINNNNNYFGASGGKHTNNTSCRIAWRSNFSAEAYVYLPKDIIQSKDYYDNIITNSKYGDSIWRDHFFFNDTQWNNITLHIKLNTFDISNNPNMDGILELTINDIKKGLYNLVWTNKSNYKIETVIFESFFGGHSSKAVTPNDTWSYFKNIIITQNK
jgi:hypothetical protein